MTEIDKIKNVSAFEDIKQNNINEQRAFQNQKADKVELSARKKSFLEWQCYNLLQQQVY